MNSLPIEFDISTTDAAAKLGVEVWLDETCVYQTDHVTETYHFRHDINDDEEITRRLKIVMTGKMPDHTQLDHDGNIVKDAMLGIHNITMDEINIDLIFYKIATYQHDFNGTGVKGSHKFFQHMGCNGTIEFKFATPGYLWLLENI
jgi:hypothetical protein